ncbi:hypothetical protein FHS61_000072 [Altererythrobacter atlanticus]|uniref:Uncharacterized protein n=1 Tax=Croceibacterium atlanticum TaxID=1267766 RepID=A0A0F7KSQ2_9SPHN|nr:hypothetical protein [Croceibacterium atlanticum]AKH42302.1 hypothetical protein WYH_01257 [Croceibacterium atlanticum]MBB5731079.1 hypothetical protein [Croceibacterium atlanticum]
MKRDLRFTMALPLLAALGLSACGDSADEPQAAAEIDPALTGALGEQIMVDPDLIGQNRANNAASIASGDGSVPTLDLGPAAIEAARADALKLVGGQGQMRDAPEPREVAGALPENAALTAAARAAAAPGGSGDCAQKVEYTMQWAAKLPVSFPVYPRGAVQEAAGTDRDGCSLRVVNYQTPAPIGEVMNFYFTMASKAGFSAQHVLQDGDNVLGGVKDASSFVVYARRLANGATEVDLVTSVR